MRVTIVGTELPGRACGPHREVRVALQVKTAHEGVVWGDAREARWTTEIEPVGEDLRGPALHGRRGERFFYLAWLETHGGATNRFRRAKLQLDGIPAPVLAAARKKGGLRGELRLTAGDGLPLCASVRPPLIRWTAEAG